MLAGFFPEYLSFSRIACFGPVSADQMNVVGGVGFFFATLRFLLVPERGILFI
jgi:hypothetical protein